VTAISLETGYWRNPVNPPLASHRARSAPCTSCAPLEPDRTMVPPAKLFARPPWIVNSSLMGKPMEKAGSPIVWYCWPIKPCTRTPPVAGDQ